MSNEEITKKETPIEHLKSGLHGVFRTMDFVHSTPGLIPEYKIDSLLETLAEITVATKARLYDLIMAGKP